MRFVCGGCYTAHMSEFAQDPTFDDTSLTLLWSSFLLRFYREGETGDWRGEVLHLQSREKRRIATLAQIQDFVSQHTPGLDEHDDSSLQPSNP